MIYVIQIKKPFRYLAGISGDKKMILNSWNSLSKEMSSNAELFEFETLNYPFWILEKEGFYFLNENELNQAIKTAKGKLKNNEDVFNLYSIQEDFLPDEPDRDEMGILKHQHFDKQKTNEWEKKGRPFLHEEF